MATTHNPDWVELLELSDRRPHEFFQSLDEINSADPIPLHAHTMRRAWVEMKLDGILCIDRAPAVYFKEIHQPDQDELRKLQRQLWNQSVAPVLVVITLNDILVYSALAVPANDNENVNENNRLVETFNRLADALKIRQFIKAVELGEFFRTNPESFDPTRKVDHYLLANLDAARDQLEKVHAPDGNLDMGMVHALLGRTIFTCYLVDRGIIRRSYFNNAGANGCRKLRDIFGRFTTEQATNILFNIFEQLKADFNGDVFGGDLQAEKQRIAPEHVDILNRFLNGDNVTDPQRSLGFWAYDFRFIPIETISGIYESFLKTEAPDEKQKSGTYYTPRFLAELVLDVALESGPLLLNKRCLDAACGSGIFLVGLFNQMAEEWLRQNKDASYDKHASALIDILRNKLFGVDKSLIACRIAAFSLYIALLDHLSPSDIQKLQEKGKFLPHLVSSKDLPKDQNPGNNIFHADFFDGDLRLPPDGFDLIIGNPPWVRPKNSKKTSSELWCQRNDLPITQRQVAAGFIWKAPLHLRDQGVVCFLLPAPLIFSYGKGVAFQRKWLSDYTIEKVINLSDMRHYLFPGSIHPAIIVRYKKERPDKKNHYIEYLTPKSESETLRADILVVSAEERKDLRLLAILNELGRGEPAYVWKEAFWGTPRDRKFLDRLREYPTLAGRGGTDTDNWKVKEGFNEGGKGEPQDRLILHEIQFLPTAAVVPYVILEPTEPEEPPTYEPRVMSSEAIFRAPHVLFTQGVGKDNRIKAGFSSFDCSFKHSVRGIHADWADEDELRFLTCALASTFASYFFFHTSFNWAIERPYVLGVECESFPFPRPDTQLRAGIVRSVAGIHRSIESAVRDDPKAYNSVLAGRRDELDKLVLEYFNVDAWEEALIRDTFEVWIPSATPRRTQQLIPALEPSSPAHRSEYMSLLLEALNTWSRRSGKRIFGEIVVSADADIGVVSLKRVDNPTPTTEVKETSSSAKLDKTLGRLNRLLPEETKSMRLLRNLKVFGRETLDILKPLARRYWTKTSALNDADEIAAAILTATRERQYGTHSR